MSQRPNPSTREIWFIALITGLITSTFSALLIVFGSHRIGRDLSLSFMEVGTVLLRYSGVQAANPLFYWVRKWVLPYYQPDYAGFGRRIGVVLAGVLVLLVSVEALFGLRLEPYVSLLGGAQARAFDQSFERSMTAHHVLGVELAQLAATKAEREELRMLGRLMVAEQQAEIESQKRWWSSWFGGEPPPTTPQEQATMPGMPSPGTLEQLAALTGPAFEAQFLDVMIFHHKGAIEMANEAWVRAADPRLRLFVDQIRHPQVTQIERMKRLRGTLSTHATRL